MGDITFSIGDGKEITVRSYDELERWLSDEQGRWSWLARNDGRTDRLGFATTLQNAWDNVIGPVRTFKSQNDELAATMPYLQALTNGSILISATADGITVLDVLHSAGDVAAGFAAGFIKRHITMAQADNPEEFLGAILTVLPDLRDPIDWTGRLKRERANHRQAARSLIERVDREADARGEANIKMVNRVSKMARRLFDGRRETWRSVQTRWQDEAENSVSDLEAQVSQSIDRITTTHETYHEFMKLSAPVAYWKQKGVDHAAREKSARRSLYAYFPITFAALAVAFVAAGRFLLNHPDTQSSKSPLALYFVVSGGLLVASTMAFWIGRLLTKLYLSEHHLRNDAEERAVMTTTYLALTTDGAASETDRHIILSALFRATPDGIVKDDGPGDAFIQSLLAKAMTK